jgi:hypothetical protein
MIMGLIWLLVIVLIVVLICSLALWVLEQMAPAEPLKKFARVAIIVVGCLIVVLLLVNAVGGLEGPGPLMLRR